MICPDNNCYFQDASWICLAHQLDLSHTNTSTSLSSLSSSSDQTNTVTLFKSISSQVFLTLFIPSFLLCFFLLTLITHNFSSHAFPLAVPQFLTLCFHVLTLRNAACFQFQKWVWLKTFMMRRREPWRLEWVGDVSVYFLFFGVSFVIIMLGINAPILGKSANCTILSLWRKKGFFLKGTELIGFFFFFFIW